jgi:ubiquinone biosynthesis protein
LKTAEQVVRAGGPAYVKLGQFIASADGLLPKEWVDAFAWCRDKVPPAAGALDTIDREFGLDQFDHVEETSFAAASIGQVHRARLTDGTDVVVKVRRPGLRASFAKDIEALALVAAAAHRLHEGVRIANLPGFVELFAQLALEELDFRLEALNMVELGACYDDAGLDYCRFPRPIPGLVTERVLVMEAVPGVPFTEAEIVDGDRLLNLAITGVLEGTLAYGRFHGDLHAGNVLIEGDTFSLVDFGICGRLDAVQRRALVRFLLGFSAMDARRQIDALETFGALPADADREALAAALQQEIDNLPPEGVSVDTLAENLGGALRILAAHGYSTPKELVLFFKNVLYLSSFTATVAPDADLLAQIGPVLAYFSGKYGDELFAMAL